MTDDEVLRFFETGDPEILIRSLRRVLMLHPDVLAAAKEDDDRVLYGDGSGLMPTDEPQQYVICPQCGVKALIAYDDDETPDGSMMAYAVVRCSCGWEAFDDVLYEMDWLDADCTT